MSNTEKKPVDDAVLLRFVPINGIAPVHLKELRNHAEIVTIEEDEPIDIGHGRSPYTFYLIEGEIQVVSGKRVTDTIFAGTAKARFSLSHMHDEKRSLRAGTRVKLLRLERSKISTLLIWSQSRDEEPGEAQEKDAGAGGAGRNAGPADPAQQAGGLVQGQQSGVEPIILTSEIFSRIPPSNVQRIRDLMEPVHVKAGDVIIQQGGPGDFYYVIRSGRCKVTKQTSPGEPPVELAELKSGDTFGEESLISESRRNATVTMVTDGKLLRLTKDNFVDLIRDPLLNTVDLAEAMVKVSAGGQLIDVRMPEEHAEDGIPGSLNIPLSQLRNRVRELRRSKPYIVYCTSGKRSSAAAFLLRERGYDASILDGGLYAIKAAPGESAKSSAGDGPEEKTENAASLQARLVTVNQEFEDALHLKVEVETAKRLAKAGNGGGEDGAGAHLSQFEQDALRASDEFERAKQQKLEIESRLRQAEANAAGERKKAESIVQKLRAQAELRLKKEDERLRHEYSEAAKKIDGIRRAKEEAEARFKRERERLEAELARVQEEIESEASKVQQKLKSAQQVSEKRAMEIREKQKLEEEQLRATLEERLRAERWRLETEFAQTVEAQEKARRIVEAAETARMDARRESERIARELKAAQAKRRAEEQSRIDNEKSRLEKEAAKARTKLEAAERAKRELTSATMKYDEIMAGIRAEERNLASATKESDAERKLRAELDAHNAAMKAAEQAFDAAMRAKVEADEAKAVVEEKVATQQAVEEELRLQLYEEMEAWLEKERNQSEEDLARARKMAEEQAAREQKKAEERRQQAAKTAEMLSDVGAQIGETDEGGADEHDQTLWQQTSAETRSTLARTARDEVVMEKEKAKRALAAARARVEALKKH